MLLRTASIERETPGRAAAVKRVYEWPLLPVVHRAELDRLEGVVSLDDILRAYRQSTD